MDRFRCWRQRLGLTNSEIARRCGVSRQAIHQWDRRGSGTVAKMEAVVTQGLRISMEEFFAPTHTADLTDPEARGIVDASSCGDVRSPKVSRTTGS